MKKEFHQLSMGELRQALLEFPSDIPVVLKDGSAFGNLYSYRGDWYEVAIDSHRDTTAVTPVKEVLSAIQNRLNNPMSRDGYRFGVFPSTPVWVDRYNETTYRAVVGVELMETGEVVIITRNRGE